MSRAGEQGEQLFELSLETLIFPFLERLKAMGVELEEGNGGGE